MSEREKLRWTVDFIIFAAFLVLVVKVLNLW